ncbi:MAG TPA: hypothetical protein VJ716_10600 [Gaiellaceae bacterium]|nr:hypothetical protein [Gaiellaceae bacterium]
MTRRERKALLVCAVVLALVCSLLFARAVLARRTADLARAQVRAALLATPKAPAPDFAERTMLSWSGGTGQLRYWQALQHFRLVASAARQSTQYTLLPQLSLVFKLEEMVASLRAVATQDDSPVRRSRLEDMLGLAYFYDAELHQGEFPVEPELEGRAISAFRQAILLDSSNDAAKTNLEVVLRKRRTQKPHTVKQPPAPDQSRIESLPQSANGLTSLNGAVGRRVRGGY